MSWRKTLDVRSYMDIMPGRDKKCENNGDTILFVCVRSIWLFFGKH